jgi:hypothetical protein
MRGILKLIILGKNITHEKRLILSNYIVTLCFSLYTRTLSSSSFYLSSSLILVFLLISYSIPRPPYPLTLFSLRPYYRNERAKRAVTHPDNIYYVLILSNSI